MRRSAAGGSRTINRGFQATPWRSRAAPGGCCSPLLVVLWWMELVPGLVVFAAWRISSPMAVQGASGRRFAPSLSTTKAVETGSGVTLSSDELRGGPGKWEVRAARRPPEAAILRAEHTVLAGTVILGRNGGPTSTSIVEALNRASRWSSTAHQLQVVRPRRWRDGRRFWFCVGKESLSILSDLGAVSASRRPASGRGDLQAPDCFFYFCAKVFCVKCEPSLSNS